ncbi:hypothetical protein BY996DRAFT_6426408 [Phakopsora pachyrhizi]|nr:hypothetical protein BY996DRAFT_6426408 [Phakopsora pachyrhizi]
MIFWKIFICLCLVEFNIILIVAALSEGSSVKTLEDIIEGSKSQNSLADQQNLVFRSNNADNIGNRLQGKHQISFTTKDVDITPFPTNKKRNFREAFENKEAEPIRLPDKFEENNILPQFSTDWGDDLLFFATEWDAFPNYLMGSHPAEIQHNFATALDGLEYSYHDYYLHGFFFLEDNPWLMHQPESFGFQSSINVNGAVETQVPEHQNLEESSLVQNHPLSSLAETEPAAVSAANSCNTLASEVGPTQQQDARELNKEGQSPNEFPENPHTLHVNRDHNISKKIRPPKAQNDVIEEVDLPLVEKQQYKTLRPEEKCILLKQEKLSKNRRSSSKKINEQNHMTKKSKETHEKSKEKKNKTVLRSEKTVKDAIDEFRLKLENLSKSSSSEGSLKLFLETLDKFADNKSSDEYLKASKGIKHEDLNMNAWNPYVELFLADNGIPICQSLLDKLKKFVVEKVNDKVGKNSDELFFKMLYFQTKENLEQNFYILPHQLKKFYNYRNSNFKVKNLGLQNVPKNWNYYSDHISKKICEAINWIPWKEFSKCDSNVELYEKREIYLKDKRTKKFGVNYGKLPRWRKGFARKFP